jgi:uncharacterized protein YidB (DUF937 family)
MGLLDNIAGQVLGGGGSQSNLLNTVMGLIGNQQTGGLAGLVQQFSGKGLGDIVNSWVGTGPNKAITPEQIQHGLGTDTVNQLAQKAGVQPDQLKSMLAEHLPSIVDKLTPKGQIPQGDITSQAMNLLGGFFK